MVGRIGKLKDVMVGAATATGACAVIAGVVVGFGLVPEPKRAEAGITVFDPAVHGQLVSEIKVLRDSYAAIQEQVGELKGIYGQWAGDIQFVQNIVENPEAMARELTGCLFSFSLGEVNVPTRSVCEVSGWALDNLWASEGTPMNMEERAAIGEKRTAIVDESLMRGVALGAYTVKSAPDQATALQGLAGDVLAGATKPGDAQLMTNKILLKIAEDVAASRLLLGALVEVQAATELERRPVIFTRDAYE